MAVGEVSVKLNLNRDGYSAGMTAARQQAQALGDSFKQVGHSTVSSMQASSAAIRVLEGGLQGNIRAAERFISLLPGVGKALQAAFPVVGGIALAGVFVRIGEEAARAIQKVEGAQQAMDNGFRSLNTSAMTTNDSLAVANDRIEAEIAKLTGRPQNNLAIAIDEARLAADKFAESLDHDNSKIKELLSQNAVPWWAGIFGKAGTSNVADTVNSQNQQLSDLAAQANVAQHSGDQAGADSLRVQIDALRSQFLQANQDDIKKRQANQKLPGGLNQGANVSALTGQDSSLFNQFDQESELARNSADEATKAKLQGAKDMAEALKQSQEALVAQWHKDLDEDKANFDLSLAQEAKFWTDRMTFTKTGSLSYIEALDSANKVIGEMRKKNSTDQTSFDKTATIMPSSMDLSRGDNAQLAEQGRQAADYLKTLNAGIDAHRQSADAIAAESIAMQIQTGRMSALAAAQAIAALHGQELADSLARIDQALAKANSMPDSLDKSNIIAGLNSQRDQVQAQGTVTSMQDQQKINDQQLGPLMKDTLSKLSQEWTNMSASIVKITSDTMNSLNSDIVQKITTGKGDFGQTLLTAGQGLLKTSLQGIEGYGLRALGLGVKADGSQAAPFYTIDANAGAAGGGGGLGGLLGGGGGDSGGGGFFGSISGLLSKIFGGGGGAGAVSGAGDAIGSALSDFGGFLAGGGDVTGGRDYVVGEQGPELFRPKSAGSIIPNGQMGGGGVTHNHYYNITSNDPAAVEAAIRRAAPHIVSASMQAHRQSARRSPGGR